MKKRVLALLLSAVLVLSALPLQAAARDGKLYGTVPVYLGYLDVDYMAQQLLAEIAPAGTPREQILQVYNWIIRSCAREGAADKPYFDMDQVAAAVAGDYMEQVLQAEMEGELVRRIDIASGVAEGPYVPFDSNYYIGTFALEMMLYRVGNCAHFSALLNLLLGHMGYDCRLIDGEFLNSDGTRTEHKWNMVLLEGRYYWLDVRMDHANFLRTGKLDHSYFLVEDTAVWEKKHLWDHSYSDAVMESADMLMEAYGLLAEIPGQVADAFEGMEPWAKCSDWAAPYLTRAVEQGLYPDVLVQADMTQNITRREFASVALGYYRALTGKDPLLKADYVNPFSDVAGDQKDILLANQLGFVQGSGGKYRPADPLTRAEAVTMLGRVVELARTGSIKDGSSLPLGQAQTVLTDASQIGSWARYYVDYFVSIGAISGVGGGRFAPADGMSREASLKVTVESMGK